MCTGLSQLNIAQHIYETVIIEIEWKLRTNIVPNFWQHFLNKCTETAADNDSEFYQFQYAVCDLEKDFRKFENILKRLQMFRQACALPSDIRDESDMFGEMLRVTLLSQLPANFEQIIYLFYSRSFKVFVNSHIGEYCAGLPAFERILSLFQNIFFLQTKSAGVITLKTMMQTPNAMDAKKRLHSVCVRRWCAPSI